MGPRNVIGAVAWLVLATSGTAVGGDREQTRAAMDEIFGAVRTLLPLSVQGGGFARPEHRESVRGALETLADGAAALAEHAAGGSAGVRYLARSLERDSRDALRQYDSHPERAQFFARQAAEYCIDCHAERPSPQDSPLTQGFVDSAAFDSLSTLERADLQVATRQFDAALGTYETLFLSASVRPAELLDPLISYLTVSIRVKNDFERPRTLLRQFARRADLWQQLRSDTKAWIDALGKLQVYRDREPELAAARELIQQARAQMPSPMDRRAIVHYVTASSILHRYVDVHPAPSAKAAEAYWLLGLTECYIGRNYWVSQADFFLETAIRMAPDQKFAVDAYALLEDQTVRAFFGSGMPQLPPDVMRRLAELKALIGLPGGKV
jgi:hypothetical protein